MSEKEFDLKESELADELFVEEREAEEEKFNKIVAERDDYKNKYLMALADLDNYKKRAVNMQQMTVENAERSVWTKILPIVDDFERAIDCNAKDNQHLDVKYLKEGFELMYRKFMNTLESAGIHQMDTFGEKFDENLHEAVSTVNLDNYEDRVIFDTVSKGYLYKDKPLRYAKVIVNKSDN